MEREIKKLISQMSLEEKAGLCSGKDFWKTKAIERLGIPCNTSATILLPDGRNYEVEAGRHEYEIVI